VLAIGREVKTMRNCQKYVFSFSARKPEEAKGDGKGGNWKDQWGGGEMFQIEE
jgi:hypothetical protein